MSAKFRPQVVEPSVSWRPPTLYSGVFLAQSGDAVGRIDGLQRGADGLRFNLTVWPGTMQRPDISIQPWEGRPNALRGCLRATADGQEYDLPAAETHPDLGEPDEVGGWVAFSGPGEHDEVAEWVGPSNADLTRPHLWLDGYSTLGFDGSLSFLAVLRTSPATVEHVDVTFAVDELDLELVWSIDLDPIYSPPADVAETAAEVSARSRWSRPLLFENMETAQSELAVGRVPDPV